MAYIRKTEDEYEIQSYTPQYGWELSTTEVTRKDAREQIKCYRANEPGVSHRIVHKRVKIGGDNVKI